METDERDLVRTISVIRIAAGVGTFLAPRVLLRLVAGVQPTRNAKFVARLFASREVALGVVTLDALERNTASVRLAELNMLTDGADAVAALLAYRRLPKGIRFLITAAAAGAVAGSGLLRRQLVENV